MSGSIKTGVPWVEKHRPSSMGSIVLDDINRDILTNVLKSNYFPNLLLHGPPGTGKTTTIINLVKEYQTQNDELNKGLMIHLNASDDRGIDTIRSQISQFVGTQGLFTQGLKFVILDEVDYMTKTAQQALRCLLNVHRGNVRFCLICNYISRIDESLQNDFIRLRFNQLPEDKIRLFLATIAREENLGLSEDMLLSVQQLHGSDIRSMINCLQSQQDAVRAPPVVTKQVWDELIDSMGVAADPEAMRGRFAGIARDYRINYSTVIKLLLNHIVRFRQSLVDEGFLVMVENLMHAKEANQEFNVMYLICCMREPIATHGSSHAVAQ
jgi:DNA polymerase III delta prime subunit